MAIVTTVMTVNCGSSSLKLRLVDESDTVLDSEDIAVHKGQIDRERLSRFTERLGRVDAVAHRIVHGGDRFTGSVLVDRDVRSELMELIPLAPAHQPMALAAIDIVADQLPGLPVVACFDTAFHSRMPDAARDYALPRQWRDRFGIRKYGFHGLSHEYASTRAVGLLADKDIRIVVCHLGAGASLAAVRHGHSLDTTMGFTPLEGLVMSTRSGRVDPSILLWLQQHAGIGVEELADTLQYHSGLLGMAGNPNIGELRGRADRDARRAVDVYLHELCAAIAAMTAALGGLDALVFTGGVGENESFVRTHVATALGYLGVTVDEPHNVGAEPDTDISTPDAAVRTLVIAAREDVPMARDARMLLGGS
ncbi:acetate/propionate family kinase [Sciscionella marina]|uniref:acetate/propionate family kinase n=1 Tax=Sciscionella marina TaxID=508770 RepID=UPI00036EC58F|nr:acetate/propionate family kinase [Sciscionella marina]